MSNLSGTNLAAKIVPFTTDDTYPTHDSLYGTGGHREVSTIVERDAIPAARQRVGMLCYVAETNKTYQLLSTGWADFAALTTLMAQFLSHCSIGQDGLPLWDGSAWGTAAVPSEYAVAGYVTEGYV